MFNAYFTLLNEKEESQFSVYLLHCCKCKFKPLEKVLIFDAMNEINLGFAMISEGSFTNDVIPSGRSSRLL
jgi:hypothetical protein